MRLIVNQHLCLKSGQCAYMQPVLFKMNESGDPTVVVEFPTGDQIEMANDAIEMCPAQAIALADQ